MTQAEVEVKAKDNLTRVVQFRVTEDVGRDLDEIAEDMDVKMSWLARRVIKEWLMSRAAKQERAAIDAQI